MPSVEILERKIKRLKKAQEEAELLLEKKSRELYEINKNLEEEVHKRTEEFEKARDAAIKASQAKSQFLANMSHEIRTPLNGMIGLLSLLKASPLNEDQKEHIEVIEQSGNLLLTIINEILEFSKIEAGKLELEYRDFNVKKCIEDILDVLSNEIYKKGLEIPVFIDEKVPDEIYSDEARIRQILLNLIGNAIKFTPKGEISISLKLAECGQMLLFEVEDTGVGIPKSKLESIFQSFSQADISDTRKYGGSGLGLTISRKILDAMKGKVFVESEEAVGSKFSFTIPLKVHEKDREIEEIDFENKVRVFVFFENKRIRENLTKRFENWNCEVVAKSHLESIGTVDESDKKTFVLIDNSLIAPQGEKIFQRFKALNSEGSIQLILAASPSAKVSLKKEFFLEPITILSKPLKRDEIYKAVKGKQQNQGEEKREETKRIVKDPGAVKLLLVEDNLINQQVAIAMLASGGYRCVVANNGQEAVDLAEKSSFDLILMDCQMPVMDGFDATHAIRKLDEQANKRTPIVAMTANAFRKTKEQCFEAGMDAFVTKPVTPETLLGVIEENLKKSA